MNVKLRVAFSDFLAYVHGCSKSEEYARRELKEAAQNLYLLTLNVQVARARKDRLRAILLHQHLSGELDSLIAQNSDASAQKNNAEISLGRSTLKCQEGGVGLKEYMCVQVGHHRNIAKTIEKWQRSGWRLHTYQVAGPYMGEINHYLLFEKGE